MIESPLSTREQYRETKENFRLESGLVRPVCMALKAAGAQVRYLNGRQPSSPDNDPIWAVAVPQLRLPVF